MFNERDGLMITVPRVKLIEALTANRTTHVADFDEATAAFRGAVLNKLREAVAAVEDGADPRLHLAINLSIPQSHQREYDTALNMLTMATDTSIVIDEKKYLQYVEDEWSWKPGFAASTALYKSQR